MNITWMGVLVGAAGMYGLLALMAWVVRRYNGEQPSYSPADFNEAAREYMTARLRVSNQIKNDPA